MALVEDGVAPEADPFEPPERGLAQRHRGPVHAAIREFLPSCIIIGFVWANKENMWAAERDELLRRCCGGIVRSGGCVMFLRGSRHPDTLLTASFVQDCDGGQAARHEGHRRRASIWATFARWS